MVFKRFANKVIDSLFDCAYIEQTAYFIEENSFWRETVYHCRRCGKVDALSQIMIGEDEFWEVHSPYYLTLDQHEK
jgi:hypothetical protein